MAITLGGVTLSKHMIWEDEDAYGLVDSVAVRTLAGNLIVRDQALVKGRPITLTAREDQGWLTKTQVDAVRGLANAAGAGYSLVIESQSFQVKFRHHEPPAFEATALIMRNNHDIDDYYTCTIKLMTV